MGRKEWMQSVNNPHEKLTPTGGRKLLKESNVPWKDDKLDIIHCFKIVYFHYKGGISMALIKCPECSREISDKATACPNCGCPIINEKEYSPPLQTQTQQPGKTKKKKNSSLSVWALVLSILGCTSIIGLIVAIIDLARKDQEDTGTNYREGRYCSCVWHRKWHCNNGRVRKESSWNS